MPIPSLNLAFVTNLFTPSPKSTTYSLSQPINHSMHRILFLLLCFSHPLFAREVVPLMGKWQFSLGEQAPSADQDWQTVTLPHDWSWEMGPRKGGAQRDKGGFRVGGIGHYRKEFQLPDSFAGKKVSLHFDGVYRDSTVSINGQKLGNRPYGYIPFHYDLTKHLKEGTNLIEVHVNNSKEPSTRWHHPCGIYAPVSLIATHPEHHFIHDSLYITTPSIQTDSATVRIQAEFNQATDKEVTIVIKNPEGKIVATSDVHTTAKLDTKLSIPNPQLWSPDSPSLYIAQLSLRKNGEVFDTHITTFGIRSIKWEKDTGFHLNGQVTKLRGVCEHLTGGPVGGAWTRELLKWKLQELKTMGCNAIRTAHNPHHHFFYDLCDELGILVMDEIFDGWLKKAPQDYGALHFDDWWRRDLEAWVRRDRNHPSIVIWSVGNETHGKVAPELVKLVNQLDPTRPVTSGDSNRNDMNVIGINGGSEKKSFYTTGPFDRAFIATEATHTWQVRGFYKSKTWYRDGYPNKRQQPFFIPDLTEKEIFPNAFLAPDQMANRKQIFLSSYDNGTVRINARQHWEKVRDLPWLAGAFRWTGFDYPGEAGYVHGGWPFHAFAGGTNDLAGFRKDLFYFYQSQWTDEPMVHVLPHWTHPQIPEGTLIPVQAYSNADEVELFLNGESLGIDKPGTTANEMQCQWMVPWQPGTLVAIAKTDGKEVARHGHLTAGAPAWLKTKFDHSIPNHTVLTIETIDEGGTFQPYGENTIFANVSGDAQILSFENGHPADPSPPVANQRRAFMGKARLFLKTSSPQYYLSLGSILGERRQLNSNLVSISVMIHPRGKVAGDTHRIYYTLDGSEPTQSSTRYVGPFEAPAVCTVKAVLFQGQDPTLKMEETFGPDLGLHWANLEESSPHNKASSTALQAEEAKFEGAVIATDADNYHGKGYLDFKGQEGFIEFYQENDGPPGDATLQIRIRKEAPNTSTPLKITLNGQPLQHPNLWSNRTWKTVTIPVKIQSGANSLRIETNGGSAPQIDEVDFQ